MFKRLRDLLNRPAEETTADDAALLAEDAELADDDAADESDFGIVDAADDAIALEEVDALPADAATEAEWEDAEDAPQPQGVGRFNPFRLSLGRTRGLFSRMNRTLAQDDITDDLWDELEETLLEADVGVQLTEKLVTTLRDRARFENMQSGKAVREALKEELQILLGEPEPLIFSDTSPISVFLVVGVNGVGKTTSIAKMANILKRENHRVLLAAGDTFRAAAVEQIKTWGDRLKVPVIGHQQGADPAAVVFDAMEAAQARKNDVLIVDTAGRLHTKANLMEELKKIGKVLARYDPRGTTRGACSSSTPPPARTRSSRPKRL